MPLDGHSYLVAQGWSGRGSGLRNGAISRPLAIPQKKTLAGVGKDRDEAFPFWDHIFSVAAKTIQVKIHKDDEDDNDSRNADLCPAPALPALPRTITGILSNKRPTTGTPASSGSCTPTTDASSSSSSVTRPRVSLMASAKRDAARMGLYSRFFRGPVLGPYDDLPAEVDTTKATVGEALNRSDTDDQQVEGDACTAVADENLKRDRKEKRKREKREKERRKAEKIKEKTKEKKVDKASTEEKQETKKRRDKGKGKEEEPIECGEINAERKQKRKQLEEVDVEEKLSKRQKRKEERERVLEDTSRVCDIDRTRKKRKKKPSSDSEVIDAPETTKNKPKAERKDKSEDKRRRKEEKKEKRR